MLKMLNKQKLEKMIREYIKIESLSKEEVVQFNTLLEVYKSCEEPIQNPPSMLNLPPKVINIPQVKKPSIIKDVSMGACISEMLTNDLFLRRQVICEVCA